MIERPSFRLTIKIAKALKVDWKELVASPLKDKVKTLNIPENEKQELSEALAKIEAIFDKKI